MIPFTLPEIGEDEQKAVLEVLRSPTFQSGKLKQFEEAARQLMRGVTCYALNSGTAGLHLALAAMGVGPGDEVIIPTLTHGTTAEVITQLGATPVLTDVSRHTRNMTPDEFERALTPKTKAVIPLHYAGLPVDLVKFWEIAGQADVGMIEDGSHALGSYYQGKPVGAWVSDACVFNFYAAGSITTIEGGMISTPHVRIQDAVDKLRSHGFEGRRKRLGATGVAAPWDYDVIQPGFDYALPDVLAAIGIVQLKRLEAMRARREWIAESYSEAFKNLAVELPPGNGHHRHSWHLYVLLLKRNNRNLFVRTMATNGVACEVHYKPLHKITAWQQFGQKKYPNADKTFAASVSLPVYSKMTNAQVDQVIESVKRCLTAT